MEEVVIHWIDYSIDTGELTIHRKLPRHLLYADDVLIFLEATRSNGRGIKKLLEDYGNIFRQKFSPSKSSVIYSSTTSTHFKRYIKRCTSIATGYLPFSYLGVPIFIGAPKVEHLAPTADLIINKFNKWHGHTLSLVGRRCLINSVIVSSLVHTMMAYRWPKTLLHRLKVAIRSYLWTGVINKKGFSNVD